MVPRIGQTAGREVGFGAQLGPKAKQRSWQNGYFWPLASNLRSPNQIFDKFTHNYFCQNFSKPGLAQLKPSSSLGDPTPGRGGGVSDSGVGCCGRQCYSTRRNALCPVPPATQDGLLVQDGDGGPGTGTGRGPPGPKPQGVGSPLHVQSQPQLGPISKPGYRPPRGFVGIIKNEGKKIPKSANSSKSIG